MVTRTKQLVFIDTSIWLNFYRTSQDVRFELLHAIDGMHDRVITSFHLRTEFLRNRQVILKASLGTIAELGKLSVPPIVERQPAAAQLKEAAKTWNEAVRLLKNDAHLMFEDPETHDPVYNSLVSLSSRTNSPVNLTADSPAAQSIVDAAVARFTQGMPPRKTGDTSCGDSIHWEWLLSCAKEQKADVVLVTGDGDFGVSFENHRYLSDYLRQEFVERVGHGRSITIDDKLGHALKKLKIKISAEALEEEKKQPAASLAPTDLVWARAAYPMTNVAEQIRSSGLSDFVEQIRKSGMNDALEQIRQSGLGSAQQQVLDQIRREEKQRQDALSVGGIHEAFLKQLNLRP